MASLKRDKWENWIVSFRVGGRTAATWASREGFGPDRIAAFLGHSAKGTTAGYMHGDAKDLEPIVEAIARAESAARALRDHLVPNLTPPRRGTATRSSGAEKT